MAKSKKDIAFKGLMVILLFVLLFFLIYFIVEKTENFTAPGLTLTSPPSWFPQLAAKKYSEKDWKTKMYLDRYPFRTSDGKDYISYDKSNMLASTDRLWKM